MSRGDKAFDSRRGQGAIEYILMTFLVVGVLTVIFYPRIRGLLGKYFQHQEEYSRVVKQETVGIPLAWFGGDFPSALGDGSQTGRFAGGETAGADTTGPDGRDSSGDRDGGGETGGKGDGQGGGDQNQDPSGQGGQGPGGRGGAGNNSLFGADGLGAGSGANRNRGRSDLGASEDGDVGGGGNVTGRGRAVNQGRGDGNFSGQDKQSGGSGQKDTKVNSPESGEVLRKERSLYGAKEDRSRSGGCASFDLKVLIQIVFIVGLLFLLASLLFQKRNGRD